MRGAPTSPRRGREPSGSPARRRWRTVVDVVAAATLAALAVASAAFEPAESASGVTRPFGGTAVALALAMTLPLSVRRHAPHAVALITSAIAALTVLAGYPVGIGPFGAIFALHSLAYTTTNRTTVAVGVPCSLLLLASLIWSPGDPILGAVAGNGLFILFALAAGVLLRIRNEQRDALVRQNLELTSAREAHIRSAVNEERLRIAREVHDAVGHTLVAITLQARVAQRRIDRRPGHAREALGEVESLAQHALDETRSAVARIRGTDRPTARAPRITAASLHGLIDAMRGHDLDIDLALDIGEHDLDIDLEQTAFRIVQESVSNVAKHAGPSKATVAVVFDGAMLSIAVTNTGSAGTTSIAGSGIRGMQERAEQLGGTLTAGPTSTGWRVQAQLPAHPRSPAVLA